MAPKLLTFNPLTSNPRHGIHLSPRSVLEAMCRYHDLLTYQDRYFSVPKLLTLWGAMALLAHALRSRPLQFGFWFLLVSLLPVCVIPIPRNGFVLYLPLVGWSLYVAALLVALRDLLIKRIPIRAPAAAILRPASLVVVGALILPLHARPRAHLAPGIHEAQGHARRIMEQLLKMRPRLQPASSLLLVDDPLPPAGLEPQLFHPVGLPRPQHLGGPHEDARAAPRQRRADAV